jgi:SAM-dependent methyltransferase
MPLSQGTIAMLRCPACSGRINPGDTEFSCANGFCVSRYPVVRGVPLLAGVARAIGQRDAALDTVAVTPGDSASPSLGARVRKLTPSIGGGDHSFIAAMHRLIASLGTVESGRLATIICLGSAADVKTIRSLVTGCPVEVVHLEMLPGSLDADIACDPGSLPLSDCVADAVVLRRILHRSLHAPALAREAVRVLRVGGLLYAEEPFAVGVQEGPDDFYRFTHLGLRGQFLDCEELGSGVAEGVGVALATSWRQLLWSLARSPYVGFALATIASFTSFFWKYLDGVIGPRARAIDGAAAVYFLGQRSATILSQQELIAGYRGAARLHVPAQPQGRPPSEVFTEWAATDRDFGMEKGHAAAVEEMLAAAIASLGPERTYTAIDAGCGNGWVVRRLRQSQRCLAAIGVDGSAGMIAKARALDPQGSYVNADLTSWDPPHTVDLVVSMEVLYYVEDPVTLLTRIAKHWLRPGGYAVIGIDHYEENAASLRWPTYVGTRMTTWSEERWLAALEDAGFRRVHAWRAAPARDWAGTLAMLVQTQSP